MTKQNSADDDLLYFLKERAKELDCLYQVDELLQPALVLARV